MGGFLLQHYYFLNLVFTVFYVSGLLVYLGRFDPDSPRTTALQRVLLGVLAWSLFDFSIDYFSRTFPGPIGFTLFRWLSLLFLFFIPAAWELVLSLIGRVETKHRLLIYTPFLAIYIVGLIAPQWVSAGNFHISGGYVGHWPPWNMAFKTAAMMGTALLLIMLLIHARQEQDTLARREKYILSLGGVCTIWGIAGAQLLQIAFGPGFPWLANLATIFISLAAFMGIKFFGRVLTPRVLFETTVRLVPNGMIHLAGGLVRWANPGMSRLLGLGNPGELVGHPLADLMVPGDDRRGTVVRLEQGRILNQEMSLIHRSGRHIDCLVNGALFDQDRPELGAVVVFSDVATLKRAEEQQLQRERIQAAIETAGAACHELNQPMQSLLVAAELLKAELGEDHPQQKRIEVILSQLERMTSITRRLSRITHYRTREYLPHSRILDLQDSSRDD